MLSQERKLLLLGKFYLYLSNDLIDILCSSGSDRLAFRARMYLSNQTKPPHPTQQKVSKDGPRKKLRKENLVARSKNEIDVTDAW